MKRSFIYLLLAILSVSAAKAEKFQPLKFGDFNHWVTRNIPESRIIGGKKKVLYEIAPDATIDGAKAYTNQGGSPWATCNVYARVAGINKGSNSVFPEVRSGSDRCAKLCTMIESCKAIGIINIDVLVAGSIFLGQMHEPVTSTNDPYSKLEMGVPYTQRPKAVRFDYKLFMPDTNERLYSSGFGKKKTLKGHDDAEVMLLLQRRWEDEKGNLYAKRVGTARERYGASTNGWVNGHDVEIHYGDITKESYYKPYMDLIPDNHSYYAKNSKGKLVPVKEVGWDAPDATPTHVVLMFSAASGDAYIGTVGLTFWVDNVGFVLDD